MSGGLGRGGRLCLPSSPRPRPAPFPVQVHSQVDESPAVTNIIEWELAPKD